MNRLVAAALLSASFTANAFTYTEVTDLPGYIYWEGAVSAGTLDVGSNTISGNLTGNCLLVPGGCNSNFWLEDSGDTIYFAVAPGTRLDRLTVDYAGASGPSGFTFSVFLTNQTQSAIANPWPIYATTPSPSGDLLDKKFTDGVFTGGVYSLSIFGQTAFEPGPFSMPYSFNLEVSAVPEPASAALMFCGGLLLATRRSRLNGKR